MNSQDPTADVWSVRSGHSRARRARVELQDHRHTYPDGTLAEVTAQYLYSTWRTVYRWRINGQRVGTTVADCTVDVPPDWSRIPRPRHEEPNMADLKTFAPARLLKLAADGQLVALCLPPTEGEETRHLLVLRTASEATTRELPADLAEAYAELAKSGCVTRPGYRRNGTDNRLAAPAVLASKLGLAPRARYDAETIALLPVGEKLHKRWSVLKTPATA